MELHGGNKFSSASRTPKQSTITPRPGVPLTEKYRRRDIAQFSSSTRTRCRLARLTSIRRTDATYYEKGMRTIWSSRSHPTEFAAIELGYQDQSAYLDVRVTNQSFLDGQPFWPSKQVVKWTLPERKYVLSVRFYREAFTIEIWRRPKIDGFSTQV